MWHSTSFPKLIEIFYSVKPKDYVQNKNRNPISVSITNELKENTSGDLRRLISNFDEKFTYPGSSTTPNEWGSHFTWALYYSLYKSFPLSENPKHFSMTINSLINQLENLCENSDKFTCEYRGFGFVPHPRYWFAGSSITKLVKGFTQITLKYIYPSIGDDFWDRLLLSSRRDEPVIENEDTSRILDLYEQVNYNSLDEIKAKRLNDSDLSLLQNFGYLIRYITFFIFLLLLIKNIKGLKR